MLNIWGDGMTPTQCLKKAKQMGYKYAGLQFGHECWAGHYAPKRMKVPESQCLQTCETDRFSNIFKCGNADRNSVWALTAEAKQVGLQQAENACGKDEALNT